MGVRDWESLGTSPSRIKEGFGETVAEVMDAEVEGEDEVHPSKRPRVAERVAKHVPPEVEPQNLDFDVNESLRTNPYPVVASVFGDCQTIRRAAVRRGYPVMRSRFFELWRWHSRPIGQRMNHECDSTNSTPTFDLAFPSRVWSSILNHASILRVRERIDRERVTELAILEWVVSLCENSGSNWGHVSRGKSCGRLELESSPNQKTSERSLLV